MRQRHLYVIVNPLLLLCRHKVDWRMLPLLGFLSALSLIDRSNLGLARIAGMDQALVCLSYPRLIVYDASISIGFECWVPL